MFKPILHMFSWNNAVIRIPLTCLGNYPTQSGKGALSHGHCQHHIKFQLFYERKRLDLVHMKGIQLIPAIAVVSATAQGYRKGRSHKEREHLFWDQLIWRERRGREQTPECTSPSSHTWTWNGTKLWHRNRSLVCQNISSSSLSLFPNRKTRSPKHIPKYVINYPMNHIPYGNILAEATALKICDKRQKETEKIVKERTLPPWLWIHGINTKTRKSWSHQKNTRYIESISHILTLTNPLLFDNLSAPLLYRV